MGGKASDGAGKSYNYFGTIAGVVRAGRIDTIHALLVDGKEIWSGPINRTDAGVGNPYTLSITDSKWLREGGYVRVYWGEDTQTTPDAALVDHPPYRGFAYVVLHRFLFGLERLIAPNVELIATAAARPDPGIIPSTDVDDGCVNPWAVVQELLTSPHAIGLPAVKLNAASFAAAHDALAASADLKALTYCAPFLLEQDEARRAISDILAVCDGLTRYDDSGRIEAVQLDPDPGDLGDYTALDANSLTKPPQVQAASWDEVPTGILIRFRDRDRQFKDSSLLVEDLRARVAAGQPSSQQIDRMVVTRRDQAQALAAEWAKRFCQPLLAGRINVRRGKAINPSGEPLRPGDRFLLDIDPEPGGDALNQLCRVLSRRFGPTGDVEINFRSEPNQPPFVSTPIYTGPTQELADVPEIENARIFAVPVSKTGGKAAVFALTSRPDDLVTGARVEFDVSSGAGTFTTLGIQIGFAVRGTLGSDYSSDDTGAVDFQVLDTRDEEILSGWVGGESASQNDELLLVVLSTYGSFIAEDADKLPVLEVCSIEAQATTAANRFDLTVLRARLGTRAQSWVAADEAWVVRRTSLLEHRHQNFPAYLINGDSLTFRLRPFSKFAEFAGTPDDLLFYFPRGLIVSPQVTWATPSDENYTLATSGDLVPDAEIIDPDGNMVRVQLYSRQLETGVVTTHLDIPFAASNRKTLADLFVAANLSSTLNFPGDATDDTQYELTLRALDASGAVGSSSRILTRLATGGGGGGGSTILATPTFTPWGEPYAASGHFPSTLAVNLVASVGSTTLHVATEQAPFSDTPPAAEGPGYAIRDGVGVLEYQNTGSTSWNLLLRNSTRVWCRCSDGTNTSAWVHCDYFKP